jgi:hypothetical protein
MTSSGDIIYEVLNDPNNRSLAGFYNRNLIKINVANQGWSGVTPAIKEKISAHEYLHALSANITSVLRVEPFWVGEGMAEYSGYAMAIDKGLISRDEAIGRSKKFVTSSQKMPPLNSITGSTPGSVYGISHLAVDFLVGGRGMQAIGDFTRNLANLKDPSAAFETTFGENMASFEGRFEAWRSANNI